MFHVIIATEIFATDIDYFLCIYHSHCSCLAKWQNLYKNWFFLIFILQKKWMRIYPQWIKFKMSTLFFLFFFWLLLVYSWNLSQHLIFFFILILQNKNYQTSIVNFVHKSIFFPSTFSLILILYIFCFFSSWNDFLFPYSGELMLTTFSIDRECKV